MTQKQTVLLLLEARGFKGVGAHELIYQHGITRGAAIIHELRKEGIAIDTIDEGDEKLARYVLDRPAPPPPVMCGCGHRVAIHTFGFTCLEYVTGISPYRKEPCPCQKAVPV